MEYQEIINWAEINDDSRRMCSTNSYIKLKTSMLKSILCHYSDASLLASGSITVVGAGADNVARSANRYNKQAIFKN